MIVSLQRAIYLLPDTRTTPRSEHARRNVHCSQLLEEKFGSVRNMDLRDPRLVLTGPAFVLLRLEFSTIVISNDICDNEVD
jgi:hypothetical protein